MARGETDFVMWNISEEHALTSEREPTLEYHTPSTSMPSSSLPPSSSSSLPSSSSSGYYSQRIHSMIANRSRFSSETELDIENSREHWSELTDSDTISTATRLANRAHFEKLKGHPEWGGFFKDVKVELGEKIAEGGQAEIYDAKVEFEDGLESAAYGYHVVKVMKGDSPLEDFQRQWPEGMLCNASKVTMKGPLMWIEGGTMVDDRFAFVMVRQWGDLRKLMDMKMRLNNNQGPPFADFEFVRKVMLCIARDMKALHTKYKIVHRDLKASNVLLWSFGEQLPDANPLVRANVVDYECSVGVVGTGFWRAPEILEQVKKRTRTSEIVFTFESDVYSYGMLCYELLTGLTPFEGHPLRDYDFVLDGNRPALPEVPPESHFLVECVEMCWLEMPLERPSFSQIVEKLKKASRYSKHWYPRNQSMIENRTRFSSETGTASAVRLRKWGDLRKLIDMKMQLNDNRGPPFESFEFVREVMLCIARDMDALHTKIKIVHRDLKASNVLLWSFDEELPDAQSHVKANVVNYECSLGLMGTEIWRAPEILEQLKRSIPSSEIKFTFESDVYSYGMVCYELLSGRIPFEGHPSGDYDVGLSGNRPEFPHMPVEARLLVECVEMCWSEMPWERPTFSEVVHCIDPSSDLRRTFVRPASAVGMRKWGDLQKLVDIKMQLNNNQGPPFADFEFVRKVMLCIARDMEALHSKYKIVRHTKHKIVHRDLKASNVLLWSFGEELPDANPHVKANVVNYESSLGVMGTEIWRAPEILEQLKRSIPSSKMKFTSESAVYSYGMVCYELLTGRTPFEGHSTRDYDIGCSGNRPALPEVPPESRFLVDCVDLCWSEMPWERPTFSELVKRLNVSASPSSVQSSLRSPSMRKWGDLRKLINMKMRLNNNRGPPFASFDFVRKVMLCIARDLDALQTRYKIMHRDLKASNVLLWSFGEELPDANPHVKANVVNYECSSGVMGTEIWRAPEILEQLKNGTPSSEIVLAIKSDVYCYGTVCYELLTGRIPFEGHPSRDSNVGLSGTKPELPQLPWENRFLVDCVEMCWSEMPLERPSFSEIVQLLEAPASSLSPSSSVHSTSRSKSMMHKWSCFSSETKADSAARLRKWGTLRKLIDMKMRLNNNREPPFGDKFGIVRDIMLCIARDMDALHTKYKIVHRDLKASNVLLWSFGEQLPDASGRVKANVVNYEGSFGVMGRAIWRASENLKQLQWNSPIKFTFESDVHSYGLLCHELLTGRIPVEDHSSRDCAVGSSGIRPELSDVPWRNRYLVRCVEMCLKEKSCERPPFSAIVKILKARR